MTNIYCTVRQLAELFRIDYSTMLGILHQDADLNPDIKKLGRYDLNRVVQLHKMTVESMEVSMNDDFLNLHEVQEILHNELGLMVSSTVLRKAAKGEVPALKFGDTYRVPESILSKSLQGKRITYRKQE